MIWAKVLIPVVLATTGVGAGAAAVVLDDDAPAATGPARAWVDNPIPGLAFGPGTVPVDGHAADPESAIAALELVVDDEVVSADDSLDRVEDLVYAQLDWQAEVGVHELVIREVGGGATSAVRIVRIVEGMAPAPERPEGGEGPELAGGTTTTAVPTTAPESTTTSVPGDTTTTVPPEGDDTIPPDADPGTTTTTTTEPVGTEPATPPTIDRAVVTPSPAVLYVQGCGYRVTVAVSAPGAEAVTASVDGTDFSQQMERSGSDFTLTIEGGARWAGAGGSRTVTVVAGNGDQTVSAVAGTFTVDERPTCPKD